MSCPGVRPAGAAPLRVYFAWHGNPSSPWFEHEAPSLERVLDAAATGAVTGFGVLKAGVETMLQRPGAKVFPLYNFPRLPPVLATGPSPADGPVPLRRIGIFGTGAHKNIAAQVLAACSLGEGVEVHTNSLPFSIHSSVESSCAHPVVEHTTMTHTVFQHILATMDLVSCEYHQVFWPLFRRDVKRGFTSEIETHAISAQASLSVTPRLSKPSTAVSPPLQT
jgi:hypothetical protein